MVKVLIATIMRPSGETGVQTHFRAFLSWLFEKGHETELVTPYSFPHWIVYPVFAVRRILDKLHGCSSVWWYRYWHTLFLKMALRRRMRYGNDCVVYAQCPLSAYAALSARQSNRQKVVLVVHFNLSQADEWAGKNMISQSGRYAVSIRKFESKLLPQLDGLVFVSKFMYAALAQRIPKITSVPATVVPNFVDAPLLPKGDVSITADLLVIGTLEPRKNQAYALQIIAAAARRGKRLTVTFAGDGPDRKMLSSLALALEISEQVSFLGHLPNAANLFSYHRACLHVALLENLPVVLIEALSRGLPVFATPVGGVIEVFSDGVEGRYLPVDSPDEAALRLIEWFDQTEHLKRASSNARATYASRFDTDTNATRLEKFLMEVAYQ